MDNECDMFPPDSGGDIQIAFQIGLHRECITVTKSGLSLNALKELAATVLEKQVIFC